MLDCTRRGEAVFDPFLGSGTTLIAAEKTGRIAFGLDLDPLYVDLAVRRWQAWTGEDAVLVGTGERFADLDAAAEAVNG
ncbi:site-specific DNA-methyltransferase [Hankyongella ginsenosidimutans]|uniref:site-specific DNA-methyltransferase (adenine-specific) n=1 Tax=Hankyongella ginsenosidimutans TaxID=1763828 RepID=A0A4D7CCC5_9SPHN|nr:site-specific DNA-methyltransferase [Hankyongella ginsenosidimutans]